MQEAKPCVEDDDGTPAQELPDQERTSEVQRQANSVADGYVHLQLSHPLLQRARMRGDLDTPHVRRKIDEIADSIHQHGYQPGWQGDEPITIDTDVDGEPRVTNGNKRLRALQQVGWNEPVPIRRRAAVKRNFYHYHVAPTSARQSIAEHGLQLGDGGRIWLWNDEGAARDYHQHLVSTGRDFDLYRADVTGYRTAADPHLKGQEDSSLRRIVRRPVPPERLELVTTPPPGENGLHERHAGKGKPRHDSPDVARRAEPSAVDPEPELGQEARGDVDPPVAPDPPGRPRFSLIEHPAVLDDVEHLPPKVQDTYFDRVDALERGDRHSSTHALHGPLVGWAGTSIGGTRYRIIHRFNGDELHVLSAGVHDEAYDDAKRRKRHFAAQSRLSDESRVSVAEHIMEQNGHSGRSFDVPNNGRMSVQNGTEYDWDDDRKHPAAHYVHDALIRDGHDPERARRFRVYPDHWNLDETHGQAITDGLNYVGTRDTTNELALLHECAHIRTRTPEGPSGHGQAFQETAHRLYHRHLGPEAADVFRGLLEASGSQKLGWRRHFAALEEDDDYRMQHRPPGRDGVPIHDLTQNFPADIYTHPHYYSDMSEPSNQVAHSVIRRVRGKPDARVHIYRALPAEHAHQGIRPGDWVTTSKDYARQHGQHSVDPKHDWPVIHTVVRADDLHTDGDDWREFGYNGAETRPGNVAFKGGYHQEVSDRADGGVRQVQRKQGPLTGKGYSFTQEHDYVGGTGGTVRAWHNDEYAGHMHYNPDGSPEEPHIEPEHAHLADELIRRMRMKLPPRQASRADLPPVLYKGVSQRALEEIRRSGDLKPSEMGESGPGVYLTGDHEYAKRYAGMGYGGGAVLHVEHSVENPLVRNLDDDADPGERKYRHMQQMTPGATTNRGGALGRALAEAGHDAVETTWRGRHEVAVHDPAKLRIVHVEPMDGEGNPKEASTYTVRLEHGRRRSPHQYTVPDDGPVTPAYLEHPVDVSYVHISVPAYDEDGNHRGDLTMENEARNTAVRMHHDQPGVPTDMVTKADVIKVEAAQATGPFFHGTAAELKPGDLIEPNRFPPTRPDPDIRGDKAEDPREHTYFTSRKQYVVEHYGPNVYEVEPMGEYRHDSEYRHPQMFKSPHPLRVVRQVTRDWGTPHTAALDPDTLPDGYSMRAWEQEKTDRWGLPAVHVRVHHPEDPSDPQRGDNEVASLSVHQRLDPDTGAPRGHPNIYVDPEHQRKGLATAMYAEVHRRWPGVPIKHSEHRSDDARKLDPALKAQFGSDLHLGRRQAGRYSDALENRRALHEDAAARGHDMRWKRQQVDDKPTNSFHGECRHCGATMSVGPSWSSTDHPNRDARSAACTGPGTKWQSDMQRELASERFQKAISQFGQDIKDSYDREWLRDQRLGRLDLHQAAGKPSDWIRDGFPQGWDVVADHPSHVLVHAPTSEVRKRIAGQGFLWRSSGDLDELTQSMREHGFDPARPVNVHPSVGIVDGHHRLEAAERAGIEKVPVAFHKTERSSQQQSDADTSHGADSFYRSDRDAHAQEQQYQDHLASPEYAQQVSDRARARHQRSIDWLDDAADRLHGEGNHELAEQARGEAQQHRDELSKLSKLDLHQVRVLNPTTGHDPDLFDGEELKPEIRRDLIHRWTVFCAQHGLANWHAYTELYFTGGEASNWSGPGSSPNGDFDMQVGLDFDEFRAVNVEWKPLSDAEVSAKLNDLFWTDLDDHDFHPAGSPRVFDLTWFSNPAVNPDISAIRPYAAWNVLREEWAVHPKHYVQAPHLPAGVRKALQGADRYARQVLALPEPQRTREAAALFESWHTDRSAAFGPGGAGVFDYANLRMKALEATGVWQQLQDAANRLAPRAATALGERLWGAGDPDALFNGNPVASTPFAPAGRSVKRQDYDKDRVRDALLHPEKYPTQPVDPRNLRSTQPMVTRAGVQHYMRNPGSLYADQHNAGNARPMVYRREDGQDLLLSGHHRGVSSLLKAEPLHAVVVEGPWGGPRVAPRKPQAARYHSAMPTATEYPPIYRHQLSTPDARRSREVSPEEFQETARRGHEQYERLRQGGSPPHGLDRNWDHVVRHAYQATREPWGGATYNAHTGEPVESDADAYALTVRHPGMPRVEVPPDASEEEFSVAMHHARNAYHDALHYRGAHLGVFHDVEKGSVDIDPVTIVHSLKDAEELGAYTHATGGAYHFKSGEGFWPPHVRES